MNQLNQERKKYSTQIFRLTWVCMIFIFILLLLSGFRIIFLPPNILKVLITSTIASPFIFFMMVVRYLFRTGPNKPMDNKTRENKRTIEE